MRTILYPEWIIDGSGASPLERHAVVIDDGSIQAVTSGEVEAAAGDQVVRAPGVTLLPGLINHHVHLVLPGDNSAFFEMNDLSDATLALRSAQNANISLRAGVTTVRDCGGRQAIILDARNAQASGVFQGARIVSCAWTITITGGHTRNFGGEADGPLALQQMVRRLVSRGADYIKVMASGGGTPGSLPAYPSFNVDELKVIVRTAHDLGKTVTTHCTCTAAIANAVEAGVDFIEHAMFTGPAGPSNYDPRVAEALAKSGIRVTPTLQVFRDLVDLLPPGPERDGWQARREAHEAQIAKLHDLGVPLLAGSDAGWRATRFDTFWKELDELVICGLSPVEAVHAATGRTAEALGLANRVGTVQPGRSADLLLARGNVAQDIGCLQYVHSVYQAGRPVVTPQERA